MKQIKKLIPEIERPLKVGSLTFILPDAEETMNKINELVDAVNKLLKKSGKK